MQLNRRVTLLIGLVVLLAGGFFLLSLANPAPTQTVVEQKLDATQFQANGH